MEPNEILRDQIFQIIKTQMETNNPPETKTTFNRLIGLGYDKFQTNPLIGQCVSIEIFNILKHHKPFDEKRYFKNLNKLPEEPFE